MTEIHHSYVQRDLAALQAAENKLATAIEKSKEAKVLEDDARRSADFARDKFHSTVAATKGGAVKLIYGMGGIVDPSRL